MEREMEMEMEMERQSRNKKRRYPKDHGMMVMMMALNLRQAMKYIKS